MSKSINFVLSHGGSLFEPSEDLAAVYCSPDKAVTLKSILNDTTEQFNYCGAEWTFDDGSIIAYIYAGIYAPQLWYFMAYSCAESDKIRYRRANPTPDTSHE